MPFEPLQTDERLETPVKPERDTDAIMLAGCTGFVSASLITYVLAIWPFFVFTEIYLISGLVRCALVGLTPALIFGAYVTRRFGLAPAAGFVGGGLSAGIFLYLRMVEVNLRRAQPDMAQPDYPESWVWIGPLGWVLLLFFVAALLIRPSEVDISGKNRSEPPSNSGR